MPSVSAASHSGGSSPSRLPCSQPSEHLGGELKWVPRAFLPPCSSSGRNVLLLLGTPYLPGISFFGSFDFFSNCGSPALAACLGYFSSRGPPLPLVPVGRGWSGICLSALGGGDGGLGAAGCQLVCFPWWGFKK